jgi:hypothetical protein
MPRAVGALRRARKAIRFINSVLAIPLLWTRGLF